MLQKQAVNTELLDLLSKLMAHDTFSNFNLVGGTSLALQIGHRVSIDIDLFGSCELDELEFTRTISELGKTIVIKKSKNILVYMVNDIKVDFVNYPYEWIDSPNNEETIRLAGKKDIGAMKLNAIAGRGSKKDFIDLYFLLKTFSLNDLLKFYLQKYPGGSEFLVLKSLSYFDDADDELSPKMLIAVEWEEIKTHILDQVKTYLK